MGQPIFITGADTGAGKTLLTALLLVHLRRSGRRAWAMKPFCSGSRADVNLLSALQDQEVPIDQVNPFCFKEPVTPLVAARRSGRFVRCAEVASAIQLLSSGSEVLLVEGAGGLLAPLGERFTLLDVIGAVRGSIIVAVRNKLGAINHALLTWKVLRDAGCPVAAMVLMDLGGNGLAAETNQSLIAEFAPDCAVLRMPFLGPNASAPGAVRRFEKKVQKTLAHVCHSAILASAFRASGASKERESRKIGLRGMRESVL